MDSLKVLDTISRMIVKVLRHDPKLLELTLDVNGWVSTQDLINGVISKGYKAFNINHLNEIVRTNNKQRLAFNEDKTKIRANQGHSIKIDLGYEPSTPPEKLYHGTAIKYLDSILTTGLDKRDRHHVHLSSNLSTATSVGRRHGEVVVLVIDALDMHNAGFKFFKSDNNVWLADHVPVDYITTL